METKAIAKAAKRTENIALLYEITKALNEHLDLKRSLYKVLDILSSSMNMVRGTITLLDPLRNEIRIEVAHGITRSAMERVTYKLGEGVTGRVIETGKAVAIPRISEEPRFLDRTASRKRTADRELSFICVPIKKGSQVIGALSGTGPTTTPTRSTRAPPAVGHRHHDRPATSSSSKPVRAGGARAPAGGEPAPAGRS